jgi:hypothetical protein
MKPTLVFLIAVALLILVPALVNAQSPPVPDKSPMPDIPAKSTPFASPQAQTSPQQSYAPQYDQPALVLWSVPRIYQVQRLACQPKKIKIKQVIKVKWGLFAVGDMMRASHPLGRYLQARTSRRRYPALPCFRL